MLSTVKNDLDWEGQIEIKYENIIPECIDIKEIKEESADRQNFKIKIEKCSIDEDLKDLPQECIEHDKDINGGNYENFDCSDNQRCKGSIGILDTKDSLECQNSGYNCVDLTNMENDVMFAYNRENECSAYQNIPLFNLVSHPSNSNDVKRKHKRVKLYKCQHCDFESDYISCLKSHINCIHTRLMLHKCEYCDYESPQKTNLKIHIVSKHNRAKLHKCQYCDYQSPQRSNLKSHINAMHTRKKSHKCEYCDYESPRKSNLNSHIKSIHTRGKIHNCQYCDYGSPWKSTLKSHINSKHTTEKYVNINSRKVTENINLKIAIMRETYTAN